MKSGGGGGGGKIFDYDLVGSRGVPPQKFFWCFRALRQLLVQSEARLSCSTFVADMLTC